MPPPVIPDLSDPQPVADNGDRRTPRLRKAYAFLWVFVVLCVIFAAMVLFVKG
jgi:hypothetical protein